MVVAYHGGARALRLGDLPPRFHPSCTSLAGRSGREQQRSGSDLPRMGSRPGGWVFLFIATRQPAAKWTVELGRADYLVAGLIRARDMGRSGPASLTSTGALLACLLRFSGLLLVREIPAPFSLFFSL